MSERRRVIVLKPCCIGDAVMALPALQRLRAALPDAHIEVWSGPHSRPVFESHPAVDAVEPVPDIPRPWHLLSLVARLRAVAADTLLILDRSRLLERAAQLSGIPSIAAVTRGPAGDRHESDCYLDALGRLGIAAMPQLPRLELNETHRWRAKERTAGLSRHFVVLHPGGAENPGARMHSKRWPVEHWVELVNWLVERDITPLMTGSAAERSLGLEIAARSQAGFDAALPLAGELDLLESAAVAAEALAYVGPDTGLSHLAAATGVPAIVIFGPTNPARYAPRGERVTVLAPRASWGIPDADLRRRSASVKLPSTSEVTPDEVIAALDEALALSPGAAR